MIFRAVDLESNGLDVNTCEVAQVALVTAPLVDGLPVLSKSKATQVLCSVKSMPAVATKVHGLTLEALAAKPPFMAKVRGVLKSLTQPDVVIVTFNGARYDLAVVARYAAKHGKLQDLVGEIEGPEAASARSRYVATRERFEDLLAARHIDVARLWQVARGLKIAAPSNKHARIRGHWPDGRTATASRDGVDEWRDDKHGQGFGLHDSMIGASREAVSAHAAHSFWDGCERVELLGSLRHAGMFAGKLADAHGFWCGRDFDGAHDATADCKATLSPLAVMLSTGFVDVEKAIRWTNAPLPGDVDFDGVFKWNDDQAVCSLKKHADVPIEEVDRGFLSWMLDPERTFHRNTKHVVREYLAGDYPIRQYEKEETT